MKNNAVKLLLIVGGLFFHQLLLSQIIRVAAKPFLVNSKDSGYSELRYKLPEFICNGILYHSSLHLDTIIDNAVTRTGNENLNIRAISLDTRSKRWFDNFHAQFFIDGEIGISNDQFYLNVYASDTIKSLITYQSPISPISDFQKIIDEACANLNHQIQFRLSGQNTKRILVDTFRIISLNSIPSSNTLYTSNFLARFLNYNLHYSKNYSILPYNYEKSIPASKADPFKEYYDIVVTGKVNFKEKDYCSVTPVIYFSATDSIELPVIKDMIVEKDRLLTKVISCIQSFLDVITDTAKVDYNKITARRSESGYEKAFDSAMSYNNTQLASYFANQLSLLSDGKNKSELLKAKIDYQENDITSALKRLDAYLKIDESNEDANYYTGLCNIKLSRYKIAKSFIWKIDTASATFKSDIHFQRGLCLYFLDSSKIALKEFNRQISFRNNSHPNVYLYIAFCHKKLNEWEEYRDNLIHLYSLDPSNTLYQRYLSGCYAEFGRKKFDSASKKPALFEEAYTYFSKSYALYKSEGNLMGVAQSMIRLKKPDAELNELVENGIKDNIFFKDFIYLDLALFSKAQIDSSHNYIPYFLRKATYLLSRHLQNINYDTTSSLCQTMGSTYFRLHILDSAEFFYNKAKLLENENPDNYFNLAELQVIRLNFNGAIATLDEAKTKLLSGEFNKINSMSTDYNLGLYYFYMMESKIIKKADFSMEQEKLKEILARNPNQNDIKLFNLWGFRTFYNWVETGENLRNLHDEVVRRQLHENLCSIVKYSDDNLLCSEK